MIRAHAPALLPLVTALAMASPSLAQQPIGTIDRGRYVCELPGDAAGSAGVVQEGAGFIIDSASRYRSDAGGGTYLRRGDELAFTSGPRNGERYRIVNPSFLRRIEADGQLGRLRCVRVSG